MINGRDYDAMSGVSIHSNKMDLVNSKKQKNPGVFSASIVYVTIVPAQFAGVLKSINDNNISNFFICIF